MSRRQYYPSWTDAELLSFAKHTMFTYLTRFTTPPRHGWTGVLIGAPTSGTNVTFTKQETPRMPSKTVDFNKPLVGCRAGKYHYIGADPRSPGRHWVAYASMLAAPYAVDAYGHPESSQFEGVRNAPECVVRYVRVFVALNGGTPAIGAFYVERPGSVGESLVLRLTYEDGELVSKEFV